MAKRRGRRPGTDARASPATEPRATPRRLSRRAVIAAVAAAAIVIGGGISWYLLAGNRGKDAAAPPTFVGSETCAGCHRAEAQLWRASQHKAAMDHATAKSVRGDFSDASFDYHGVRSRFFRQDGKFMVETDGPDGKLGTFEAKYTFGVDPLQQYLIEFPDGRLQALSIAWDTRPKEQGGQRWFHLYPNEEIKHDDVLHWTKLNQNWNFMCAECHSTGVRKNYDPASDRFATTGIEISVGCEACHGQGSSHVAWARAQQSWWPFAKRDDPRKGLLARFDERQRITWPQDPRSGEPQRSIAPALLRKEVETCGRCHARRSQISEDWVPGRWLSDTHVVSPPSSSLLAADGQMRDGEETYNYVPFKQSKMFAAGVTCSDCHEPHSGKPRAAGNGVCLQCHAPATYAAAAHSHHDNAGAPGCVSCHMPERTYMVVDRRHDHSLRVPRPDLSVKLGTPNACNDCHADKPPAWAAAAVEGWFGPQRKGFQTYADAFQTAWSGRADSGALLARVAGEANAPGVIRAAAFTELAAHVTPATAPLARRGLADPDPMVRGAAIDMLEAVPPAQAWPLVAPLLSDPVRSVRLRAVSLLAAAPVTSQPAADRERFERAASEFVAAQRLNADRPEARTTLGSFYARRGSVAEAEAEYRAALRLNAQFAPAAINLADLYRQSGRDGEGEVVLRGAIASSPQDAGLHHALGLVLTRLKRSDDALAELRRAAELEPDRARYGYVYAVALHTAQRNDDAMTILKTVLERHPADRDSLIAAVTFSRDAGDIAAALGYAERLANIAPDDAGVKDLVSNLRRRVTPPVQ